MINFYDSAYDQAMTQSLTEPDKKQAVTAVLKAFHGTVWTHSEIHTFQSWISKVIWYRVMKEEKCNGFIATHVATTVICCGQ